MHPPVLIPRLLAIVCLLSAPVLFANSSINETYCRSDDSGRQWTLGNGLVERTVAFSEKAGLHTRSLRNLQTDAEFEAGAITSGKWRPEFRFKLGDTSVSGTSEGGDNSPFEWVEARTTESPRGRRLAVELRAPALALRVVVNYEVFPGHPALRKWIEIVNEGAAPRTLSHLRFEMIPTPFTPPTNVVVNAFYARHPRELMFTGRVEDMCMSMTDTKSGEALYVLNEAPGQMKRTEFYDWASADVGIGVMMDTDIFPFERVLAPGERWTSPAASLVLANERDGRRDPRWVLPSYTTEILTQKGAAFRPIFLYNTWVPFQRTINEATCYDLIDHAARMGLDVFSIDDGWLHMYGTNDIERTRFPHGLEGIRDACESKGMRFGLWVSLAAVDPACPDVKEHPEWLCRDMNGKVRSTFTLGGDMAVMCLATPFRERAARRLAELVQRYRLRYLKLDLTTVFNTYGETPGCATEGHDHANWTQSLNGIYESMRWITEQVYRQHPDLLIDLTFEVWGEKHILDYGLLAAGDLDWLSNVPDARPTDAGPRQVRQLVYHRALAVPAEAMLPGNLQAEVGSAEEHFATWISCSSLVCGDLRLISPERQQWYGKMTRWYKTLRDRAPLYQGFFPFGSWQQVTSTRWDGYARLSREGEGFIALFANDSGAERFSIAIPGLPAGAYKLVSVYTGRDHGTFTAERFAAGFEIETSERTDVIEVHPLPADSSPAENSAHNKN